jgi:predicted DNA-binding transcriptional regulator AlpA
MINVERHETLVIKASARLRTGYCPDCSGRVELINLNEAVRISGLSSRSVYRLIERGQIHFTETADGVGLICPATLPSRFGLTNETMSERLEK